jgi:phage tail tube protein FII
MPANTIFNLEAVNLICGDTGGGSQPGFPTHLQIQEIKLPGLQEAFVDHNAGGARVGIEIPTHLNKLEMTFNLLGWNPDIMGMIGRSARADQRYTCYGLIRDRRTGAALQMRAYAEGRLGRVNPANFRRGDAHHHEYSVNAIIHYELYMQEQAVAGAAGVDTALREIYYWDYFEDIVRVNAVDTAAEERLILAIPGAPI